MNNTAGAAASAKSVTSTTAASDYENITFRYHICSKISRF
jgi:hypothetical protein